MAKACIFTHHDATVAASAIPTLVKAARDHQLELVASDAEVAKHPALREAINPATRGDHWQAAARSADVAIVLGGDGTLLRVLHEFAGGPPALGVNFGLLGYLSGTTADALPQAVGRVARGDFVATELPLLNLELAGTNAVAVNDVVATGGATGGIIELSWRILHPEKGVEGALLVDEMGHVPCDGMVLATPVGSTAYSLSNGGPLIAWGVDGYVVSFIAPHTLLARPLVVAPDHVVELEHMGRGGELRIFTDGRHIGELGPGESLRVRRSQQCARIVLLDGQSFYARYRAHFANLPPLVRGAPQAVPRPSLREHSSASRTVGADT